MYDGLLTAANVTSATLNYCINTTCSSDQYNSLYLSNFPLVGASCKDVGLEPFRFTCLTTGQADPPLLSLPSPHPVPDGRSDMADVRRDAVMHLRLESGIVCPIALPALRVRPA